MVGGVKIRCQIILFWSLHLEKTQAITRHAALTYIPLDFFSSVTPLWHVLYTLIVTCISLKLDYFLVSKLLVILFFFFPPHLFLTGQIIIALQSLVPGSPAAQPLLLQPFTPRQESLCSDVPVKPPLGGLFTWLALTAAGELTSAHRTPLLMSQREPACPGSVVVEGMNGLSV